MPLAQLQAITQRASYLWTDVDWLAIGTIGAGVLLLLFALLMDRFGRWGRA